ncbi:MAG: hypothetical protein J6P80_02005, partial [Kiritimatiellae bacterium]|nr:hypothetical protein [Kiritimatiellia bacterium]
RTTRTPKTALLHRRRTDLPDIQPWILNHAHAIAVFALTPLTKRHKKAHNIRRSRAIAGAERNVR